MNVVIVSEIRLLGESVAQSLAARDPSMTTMLAVGIGHVRDLVARGGRIDVAIVDMTQGLDLDAVRIFHQRHRALPLLALGLEEQEQAIVAHGSAGFSCYVRREDGIDRLYATLCDAVAGRLTCPPEIAGSIMRALFRVAPAAQPDGPVALRLALTSREAEVARHVAEALSNKEIARLLGLSESTVKHHVHSILGKCDLSTRRELMRRMRMDGPVSAPSRLAG